MLTPGMVLKKVPQEFICQCIKAWIGEMGHAHIETVCLMNGNANNTKYILDNIKDDCKPRSNEIVAATAHMNSHTDNKDDIPCTLTGIVENISIFRY